ncbi:RIP metalloprotease RseP [Roseococcus pinisoli]|uniref:Zinc metalloprotease n=1 Tax=Roseococcus pinisoli TaxID=2835040 RepID=A0ABS5QG80_9PROT|nr:RIP metalloprotease RseP [Roseococcus pinisoli]MBS7812518.1 RIP metalloprotease RseP [Roseococcus pinisoli]
MLEFLPSAVRTLLAFLVVLGVLVFFHELGHYLAARWRKVHVDAFSIGFGKPIATWHDRRGTEWRIAWIPLGGYVKLHGQAPMDETPEAERVVERPGMTFHNKSVLDRAIVVAAGPIANFLLAALLFALLFATNGIPTGLTSVAAVSPGSAAETAGILPGDTIIALDGNRVTRFDQVQHHIQPRAGQQVAVQITREGREMTLQVVPAVRPGSEAQPIGILGIQGGQATFERLNPASALWAGTVQTAEVSWATLAGIGEMLTGSRSAQELGGPIRIAEVSGQAATLGIVPLINLMALLSVSLALLNLFPIPLLDGGHLMFYAAEAIRGRPLPPKALEYGFRAGFAVLICLFLFATWNDVAHGGIGRWVAGLIG